MSSKDDGCVYFFVKVDVGCDVSWPHEDLTACAVVCVYVRVDELLPARVCVGTLLRSRRLV